MQVHSEPEPMAEDLYGILAQEDAAERRSLRVSLLVAGAAHLALLLLTIPEIYSKEVEPPERPKPLVLTQTPKFRPPPPPVEHIPQRRVKRIPMPDPEPERPEPLRLEEIEVADDLPIDDLPFTIPERPPEPEPSGPLQAGVGGVTKPERLVSPPPIYPEIARQVRMQGQVILQTVIDERGFVQEIKVLKPLGFGLTEAAVDAVQSWQFTPATLRGKPVAVIYHLTVNFELS